VVRGENLGCHSELYATALKARALSRKAAKTPRKAKKEIKNFFLPALSVSLCLCG
jgi:hypothetical protein